MLKTANLNPAKSLDDYDRAMGMFALLGATSAFGELKLNVAIPILHGALRAGNCRIFLGDTDRPSAGVVWAFLNDEMVETYLSTGFLPSVAAWNSGAQLWFLHVIAEGGTIKDILKDFIHDPVFKDHERAFMLRVGARRSRRVVELTRTGARLHRVLTPPSDPSENEKRHSA